ncbi:vegetative cell wall protein gp1-like [Sorghum bicolor]|uniref:vegetative cell wall protein gp1-like n=1 Tax=Sorghum bicolor TaxID=4558 RepID=UPI000B424027|nr:vegetative cell wall protein gp1-like [Sorghum bicolor]|eukprot:XP_021319269.1 vegetative cell wall protein gp1-like [Sorghum bicolor]
MLPAEPPPRRTRAPEHPDASTPSPSSSRAAATASPSVPCDAEHRRAELRPASTAPTSPGAADPLFVEHLTAVAATRLVLDPAAPSFDCDLAQEPAASPSSPASSPPSPVFGQHREHGAPPRPRPRPRHDLDAEQELRTPAGARRHDHDRAAPSTATPTPTQFCATPRRHPHPHHQHRPRPQA